MSAVRTINDVPTLQDPPATAGKPSKKPRGGAPSARFEFEVISEAIFYGEDFAYFSSAEEAASDGRA
jgi:hypothetical protein